MFGRLVLVRRRAVGAAVNPVQWAALITVLKRIADAMETVAEAQPKPVDRDIQLPHRPSWVTEYPR